MDELKKVKFTGKVTVAPLSGKKCIYFETSIFFVDKNWGSTFRDYDCTSDSFNTEIDGQTIEMYVPPARLYLKPIYEKEYNSKTAPAKIKEILKNVFGEEIPEKVLFREWALLSDKEYLLRVVSESYYLPPEPDSNKPTEKFFTAYYVFDKEYSKEEKEKYETPRSMWIGG